MATAVPPQRRWFFGPVSDLLFGCGLLYAGLFAWQALAGPAMRSALPYSLFPLLTLLLGAPHYGGTLLRVYENREHRRKYWVFSETGDSTEDSACVSTMSSRVVLSL